MYGIMKTELFRTHWQIPRMGEVLSVQMPHEIKQILKRVRPSNWVFPTPPVKRFKTFHDDGAKAPNLDKIVQVN